MDHGVLNVPLAKRGNIDKQIDAHKAEQSRLAKLESVKATRTGVLHLFKGEFPRVFANMTQAAAAAERTGGEPYKSLTSGRFMVRFSA